MRHGHISQEKKDVSTVTPHESKEDVLCVLFGFLLT